ncbi:hypothetical protein NM688_g7579 [Phlebia brevispora]|uniref:Uncharacterized protein n=1 Tax=Phlebia brevispora TaxID=194682 RepID=A0ACC1S3M9_9APHY|nr:hypothetical protein NM688_g7579 [Phlebia brevispora]
MSAETEVRYVVAGNPTGWAAMAQTIREKDADKVKDCKEDIDTLLVFTGLFSAVMTAFVIESYQNLSPDKTDTIIHLLDRISNQTSAEDTVSSLSSAKSQTVFEPSLAATRVNQLWFASLILTLITASFGMLVKQWLREYLAVDYTSPHERLRARQFRYPGLADFKVFEIAGALPLLLQLALGLFFLGLCFFTWSVEPAVGKTSVVLVSGWAFLFTCATIAPIFSSRCPFKTAILKQVMIILRSRIRSTLFPLTLHTGLLSAHRVAVLGVQKDARRFGFLNSQSFVEEDEVVKNGMDEIAFLADVDAFLLDDDLLGTTMFDSLTQYHADPPTVIKFVLQALNNRLYGVTLVQPLASNPDLRRLTIRGWVAVMDIVADTLLQGFARNVPISRGQWFQDAVFLLFSESDKLMTPNARNALVHSVRSNSISAFGDLLTSLSSSPGFLSRFHTNDILKPLSRYLDDLLSKRSIDPLDVIHFVLQVISLETGHVAAMPLPSILDLKALSQSMWEFAADVISAVVLHGVTKTGDKEPDVEDWFEDAIHILFSVSSYPLTHTGLHALSRCIDVSSVYQRFGRCLSPLVAPESAYVEPTISRLRDLGKLITGLAEMNWLLRQVIGSMDCTPMCKHRRTNPPLVDLVYDHVSQDEAWGRQCFPLLADRMETVTSIIKGPAWPPGAAESFRALISYPSSPHMHPSVPPVILKIITTEMSAGPALSELLSKDWSSHSRIRMDDAASNVLLLLREADSKDRVSFVAAMQKSCEQYLTPELREKFDSVKTCNYVRLCTLLSRVHLEVSFDSNLTQTWNEFYVECAKAMELFRISMYSGTMKEEKESTIQLAEQALTILDSLDAAERVANPIDPSKDSATPSTFPDEIFRQLAEFVPEKVGLQHKRVQQLRIIGVMRDSAESSLRGTTNDDPRAGSGSGSGSDGKDGAGLWEALQQLDRLNHVAKLLQSIQQ